jgi:hypothetical protein
MHVGRWFLRVIGLEINAKIFIGNGKSGAGNGKIPIILRVEAYERTGFRAEHWGVR